MIGYEIGPAQSSAGDTECSWCGKHAEITHPVIRDPFVTRLCPKCVPLFEEDMQGLAVPPEDRTPEYDDT